MTSIPPALEATLSRYLEIQRQENQLREEKTALQNQLAAFMEANRQTQWNPELAGQPLVVRYRKTVRVTYDEAILHERLGDRYRALLAPNLRKLRAHLNELAPQLSPAMLDKVGSPVPEKVKVAIASGVVRQAEFKGAFRKEEAVSVSVSRRPVMTPSAHIPTE